MNLAELRGGVIMRLTPREKIPLAAVDIEIYNAMRDILMAARMTQNEKFDVQEYTNIESSKDICLYPDLCEEIRKMFWMATGGGPVPMTRVNLSDGVNLSGFPIPVSPLSYSGIPFAYVDKPNEKRIQLTTRPSQSFENALLWQYFPKPKRLVKQNDEPNIPEPIHECIIPQATMRMGTYSGIALAHPDKFSIYKNEMQARLITYLQPQSIDATEQGVPDAEAYY